MLSKFIKGASILALSIGLVATSVGPADAAGNDRFMKIMERGKLFVGVKADYKPWGFRNSEGDLDGMEIDMARDVAKSLGVELKLIPVQSSNRMQFLKQGKIDLMIATMGDRSDRRKATGIVDPGYFTSGTNMMAKKGVLKKWEDLRGKPVCGKQGAYYNRIVGRRYGAKVVAFIGNAEAKQALRNEKCVGFVWDDSSIVNALSTGKWDGYEMPLVTEDDSPWAVAVPKSEVNSVWGRFMSGMLYHWHASGRLIELEKKWKIKTTAYLARMHEKFKFEHAHLK